MSTQNTVYVTAITAGLLEGIASGKVKGIGKPLSGRSISRTRRVRRRFAAVQPQFCGYSAEYLFTSDAATGSIVSFSINYYGNPHPTQVATGFAVNKKSGWTRLGPSGLAYIRRRTSFTSPTA